jgi:hypothetical protein
LKENSRGSISGIVKPETGQANFSEKTIRSCVSLPPFATARRPSRAAGSGLSANSAMAARRQAQRGLKLSARRVAMSIAHDDPVHHHVDVVLELLVERGASAIS